jgi:hypothetical protein
VRQTFYSATPEAKKAVLYSPVFTLDGAAIQFFHPGSPDTQSSSATAPSTNLNTATVLQHISKQIEQQLPELASVSITAGTSSSAVVWQGEEYARAGFALAKNPRYPPREFLRARRIPLWDLEVIIARYASSSEAQAALEKSLSQRPAMAPSKESYKGASLYRYASGARNAVCHSGQYVVEITPFSEGAGPLTMKVLDVVLGELGSASSKSK